MSKQRVSINVNITPEDRDVEAWLEEKQGEFAQQWGKEPALTRVVMMSLRQQMRAEANG